MNGKWYWLLLALLVAALGCAQEEKAVLSMTDAKAVPATVAPGEETLLCVKVADSKGVVMSVIATVWEFPEYALDLNDDNEEGDEDAGDGIWSYAMDIPAEAPPGVYNFDFEAYDADNNLIKVTAETGEEKILTAEAAVEVTY